MISLTFLFACLLTLDFVAGSAQGGDKRRCTVNPNGFFRLVRGSSAGSSSNVASIDSACFSEWDVWTGAGYKPNGQKCYTNRDCIDIYGRLNPCVSSPELSIGYCLFQPFMMSSTFRGNNFDPSWSEQVYENFKRSSQPPDNRQKSSTIMAQQLGLNVPEHRKSEVESVVEESTSPSPYSTSLLLQSYLQANYRPNGRLCEDSTSCHGTDEPLSFCFKFASDKPGMCLYNSQNGLRNLRRVISSDNAVVAQVDSAVARDQPRSQRSSQRSSSGPTSASRPQTSQDVYFYRSSRNRRAGQSNNVACVDSACDEIDGTPNADWRSTSELCYRHSDCMASPGGQCHVDLSLARYNSYGNYYGECKYPLTRWTGPIDYPSEYGRRHA